MSKTTVGLGNPQTENHPHPFGCDTVKSVQTRSAPVVRELAAGAQRVTAIPHDTPWPDISGQSGLVGTYPYYREDGAGTIMMARYALPDTTHPGQHKNKACPYTLWQMPDGACAWARKNMEEKWPLYNLPELVARPDAMVLISEDETCAEAVKVAFPDCVSVSVVSGSRSLHRTDTSHLEGRDVVFFPTHIGDHAGTAARVQDGLKEAGMTRIRILDIAALGQLVLQGKDVPQGYDIAAAIGDGLTGETFKTLLATNPDLLAEVKYGPSPEVDETDQETPDDGPEPEEQDPVLAHLLEEWGEVPDLPDGFSLGEAGIFKHGTTGRDVPVSTYAGSPLAVVGRSHSGADGGGWGYVMTFRRPDGSWKPVILPGRLLAGDGREMREILADGGHISPLDRAGRQALAEYIAYAKPTNFIEIATRPGWYGESFALPQSVITPAGISRNVQLDMQGRVHFFAEAGTLEGWKALAGLVEHSSRAAFVLALAFAAPLLRLLDEGGGGVHLYGSSSRGKTTLLRLAGSVWGGGGRDGFVRSWLATGNGIEGVAADHNDVLLALDELTMMPPELAADLYYMMANGHGKARATKTGSAQKSAQWYAMVLSSGEDTSTAHIRSGNRGSQRRLTGGLSVRMVDIPIEPVAGQTFEDLAGFESEGALAEHIGHQACRVYGHAGPAFVRYLVGNLEKNLTIARDVMDLFLQTVAEPDDDPQVRRVAKRFALVAAAGTLATRADVLPWQKKSALIAALACYIAWKEARGTNRSEEEREALRVLRAFFELHGASRFEPVRPEAAGPEDPVMVQENDRAVRDRCGYRTTDHDGNAVYYVFPEAFRSQVCGGHSPEVVLGVARACEALLLGEDGRLQKKVRLPEYPGGKRVYAFLLHKLS